MIQGIWTAASGMEAHRWRVDAVAHNLANANTPGFKAQEAHLGDGEYYLPASGQEVGSGVRLVEVRRDFRQGPLEATGGTWDLALEGEGFFRLKAGEKTAYTRGGNFRLDGERKLVSPEGYPVLSEGGGEIVVPADGSEIRVETDGTIVAVKPDGTSATVAKLAVDAFPNPEGLESLGGGLYGETKASGPPQAAQNFSVRQGFLEMSNVELAEEMVRLMTAQRAYELAARAVQTADHLLEVANGLRR